MRQGESSLSCIEIRSLFCIACKHWLTTCIDSGVSSGMVGMDAHVPFGNVVFIVSNSVDNTWHNSGESSQLARVSEMRSFRNILSASETITSGKSGRIDSSPSSLSLGSTSELANKCS